MSKGKAGRPEKPKDEKFKVQAFKAPPALLSRIEAWRGARELGRSEAIRALIETGLDVSESTPSSEDI